MCEELFYDVTPKNIGSLLASTVWTFNIHWIFPLHK